MIVNRGANPLIDIKVDNKTILSKKLLGENLIKASFTLTQYVQFQLGDFVNFKGQTYSINKEPEVTKASAREWQYNIEFHGPEYAMESALFMLDGKSDFPLNKDVDGFLDLIINNLNRVAGSAVYTRGAAPSTGYKNLVFSGENCLDVLKKVCAAFEVEYIFTNDAKTITIVESINNPQSLNFQFKAGLKNISRKELGERKLVTRLYAFGSTRNVITADYGFNRLRLAAPHYLENNVGSFGVVEGQVIFEDIYPRRTGVLSSVAGADPLKFTDTTLDFDINAYLGSNTAKITFNTGALAGYEFEIYSYNHTTKEFEINPITDAQELTLPNATLKPAPGDEYVLHDIKMPATYIANAEAELLAAATDYLAENSSPNVVYDITPDPVYFRNNVISVDTGYVVTIQDTDFGITIQTKILELTQSLADEYRYTIRVGEKVVINYVNRVLNGIISNSSAITLEKIDRTLEATRLRNAYNALSGLPDLVFDPDGYYYSDKIKPLSIETLSLAVGAKPLQMNFIGLEIETNYQGIANQIRLSSATLFNFTIEEAPRQWTIAASTPTIPDNNVRYLYARVSRDPLVNTGVWLVSSSQLTITAQSTTYTFLVAVIHAVADGVRGLSQVYGATFINGRFITTGRVQSINELNYFDLDQNQFKLGDANSGIDWNVTNPNKLTIKGGIMQSSSGDTFPAVVFRGAYNNGTTYYEGDAVTYQGSTWLYINATPASGNVPVEGVRWTLWAAQGADGATGPQGDPGPQGEVGPAGPAGADGIDGVDGLNGTDGNDGFGAIPYATAPATIGGYSDAKVFLDQQSETTVNPGEIFVRLTRLVDSKQNVKQDGLYRQAINTPFGEGEAGIFYLIWSDTLFSTRATGGLPPASIDGNIIPVINEGGTWYAIGNSTNGRYGITIQATDVFMFAIEAKATTGGLTGFLSFLSGATGLDAVQAGYFYDDFTEYGDEIDFWEKWLFYSGTQSELSLYTGVHASVGGQSIIIGDNSGNDQIWAVSKKLLAYDPEDLYQITAKIKSISGSGNVYFGINGYAGDGVTSVNIAGQNSLSSQHYFAASGVNPAEGVETTFVGYFQGIAGDSLAGGTHSDPADPGQVHEDAKYIAAMFIVNYSGQAGQVVIQSIEIKKVNDFSPIPRGGYLNGVTYYRGNVVTWLGSSYIAKTTSINLTPNTNPSVWTLIAQKGDTGATGATGATGPSPVFVGAFANGGTYHYTSVRRDVVFYSGAYYLYNVPSSSSGNVEAAWSAGDWVSYGNVFDMVATNLILADSANIADWVISGGKITSTTTYNGQPKAQLNGNDGSITFNGSSRVFSNTGGSNSIVNATLTMNNQGFIIDRIAAQGQWASRVRVEPDRISLDSAKMSGGGDVYTGQWIGFEGDIDVNARRVTGNEFVAAFYGKVNNLDGDSTEAVGYGGHFQGLYFTGPVTMGVRRTSGTFTIARNSTDYLIICTGASTVILPLNPEVGRAFIIKRATSSSVAVNGNGRSIYHNAVEGTSVLVPEHGEAWHVIFDGTYWQGMLFNN